MNLVNIVEKTYLNQNATIPDNQKILDTDINQIVSALNNLTNTFYPIGSYYETSDTTFDPNVSWGGTWVKDSAGLVTVSQKIGDSDFGTVGKTGGTKDTYIQYVTSGYGMQVGSSSYSDRIIVGKGNLSQDIYDKGNLQPYKVVIRWHRTA